MKVLYLAVQPRARAFMKEALDCMPGNLLHAPECWELPGVFTSWPDIVAFEGWPDLSDMVIARRVTPSPVVVMGVSVVATRVALYDAGFDDVLPGDVDMTEIPARLRAVVRRSRGGTHLVLAAAGLELDTGSRLTRYRGVRVPLSAGQFDVLARLIASDGDVVSGDEIARLACTHGGAGSRGLVRVHIYNLRAVLRTAGVGDVIESVASRGYRFAAADAPAAPAEAA